LLSLALTPAQANIGELDVRRTRETLIFGNLALLQVQALIVSSFAGVLAFVLGVMTPEAAPAATAPRTVNMLQRVMARKPASQSSTHLSPRRIIHHHPHPKPPADPALRLRNGYFEFVLVIATGMLSASLSSAILGSFMCALVVVTRRMGGNPDNIASPLAASLGDLLTLTLLGLLASLLVHFEGTLLATVILAALVVACASCFVATYRNAYVRELLSSGWVPLLIAMFISSGAGLLLDTFVQRFEGFALLGPVVTGLPGACAAIFVSRTSTALHSGKGVAANLSPPRRPPRVGAAPSRLSLARLQAFLPPPTEGWLVPCTLFAIGAGIETLFLLVVWLSGQMTFGWPFALCFVVIGAAGFAIALAIAHFITLALWARDYDPGESAARGRHDMFT
jgi:solute carrier family 41